MPSVKLQQGNSETFKNFNKVNQQSLTHRQVLMWMKFSGNQRKLICQNELSVCYPHKCSLTGRTVIIFRCVFRTSVELSGFAMRLRAAQKVRGSCNLINHHRHLKVDHVLVWIKECTVIFEERRKKSFFFFFGSVIDSSQNALTLKCSYVK